MKWSRSKNSDEQLKKLLKNSATDFKFDPNSVKFRLLNSIASSEQVIVKHFKFVRVLKYSVGFAGMVIIVSTTFAVASNAVPGDRLFALNKAGEKVVLSLPLPAQERAEVQAYFVNQRFEDLEQVKTKPDKPTASDTKKLQAIKESERSLTSAINSITENRKRLDTRANAKTSKKLVGILDDLQKKALEKETLIKQLEDDIGDKETRDKIHEHLELIQKSRRQAQEEIDKLNSQIEVQEKSR